MNRGLESCIKNKFRGCLACHSNHFFCVLFSNFMLSTLVPLACECLVGERPSKKGSLAVQVEN